MTATVTTRRKHRRAGKQPNRHRTSEVSAEHRIDGDEEQPAAKRACVKKERQVCCVCNKLLSAKKPERAPRLLPCAHTFCLPCLARHVIEEPRSAKLHSFRLR